jgi:hypothetical protein
VTPIFKKGRRNNVEDYRGVVFFPCNSEAFRVAGLYNYVRRLEQFDTCESAWLYEEPIDGDKLVGVRFFCAEFN